MSATLELVSRIALKWLEKRPFSAEARARRKAKRAARRAGASTDLIDHQQPVEVSDMNSSVLVQIVLGFLRHAMTAVAPLGIVLSDDALIQFATVIVTGLGLLWSAVRKVQREKD